MSFLNIPLFLGLASVVLLTVPIYGEVEKSDLVSLDSKTLYAAVGRSVNILARAAEGRTIQFCRWDSVNNSKVGNNGLIFVNDVDEIPSFSVSAFQSPADKKSRQIQGYDSFGSGLTNGECGITIQNVTQEDLTTWKYLLIEFSKADGNPTAVTRDVQVEKAIQPTRPVISDKKLLQNIVESEGKVVISCCSNNGVPNPHLEFQFDNAPLPSSSSEGSNDSNGFCIQTERNFTRVDNGTKLTCISKHLTFGGQEEDSVDVKISFGPHLLTSITYPTNSTIHYHLPIEENYVSVQFEASPQLGVKWYIKNEASGQFVDVNTKSFSFKTINTKPWTWESTLRLNAETSNSSQTIFKVMATNSVGGTEVYILVSKNINHPFPGEGVGFAWYWLLAPLVAFVLFIVLVVIFVICGRSNGWLCWKRNVRNYNVQGNNVVYDPVMSTSEKP